MRSIDHPAIAVKNLDQAAELYASLGFTLTPRAQHNDQMGTSNRLMQFSGGNFIEILEVDRPHLLLPHDFTTDPPRFSFGAQHRDFLARGSGMSMLALTTDDTVADLARFEEMELDVYAPYRFERLAKQPDGSRVTVAFTLGYITSPKLPGIAFFICQQHAPEYFWKTAYQDHANGAQGIAAVYISAEDPDEHVPFLTKLCGGSTEPVDGGQRVSCGEQEIVVMTPEALLQAVPDAGGSDIAVPRFAGLALRTSMLPEKPVSMANGLFIEWQAA